VCALVINIIIISTHSFLNRSRSHAC